MVKFNLDSFYELKTNADKGHKESQFNAPVNESVSAWAETE